MYINDDLTTLRNKLVMELKKEDNIKQVWPIEGRIFCIQMDQGREVKRVLDSPKTCSRLVGANNEWLKWVYTVIKYTPV